MKIEETKNGNIKIVMSKEETNSLYILLNQLEQEDLYRKLGIGNKVQVEHIVELWDLLYISKHLYD